MTEDYDPLSQTQQFQHPIDPYGIGPEGAAAGGAQPRGLKHRLARLGALRLAGLGVGVALAVGGVAWGTSAALASTDSSSSSTAQPAATTPGSDPAANAPAGKKKGRAVRLKITALAPGSFTAVDAKGRTLTVNYGDGTKFGNKTHPLTADQLTVGMTVTVAGDRKGDTITAASIGVPVKKPTAGGTPSDGGAFPSTEEPTTSSS